MHGSLHRRRLGGLVPGILVGLVAACSLAVPAGATAGPVRTKAPSSRLRWPADAVPGSLLVTTGNGRTTDVHVTPGDETAQAARLRSRPGVLAVEPDHLRHMLKTPNDPLYPQQWAHTLADTPAAWDITTGSPAVTVAIIDTGIDGTADDVRPNLLAQVDVSSGSLVDAGVGVDNDPCKIGHGTFVAGVVGAVGDNGVGVAGVAWHVGILDVAASDRSRCGLFADSSVVAAIDYAAAKHVDVINLSLGGFGDTCPTSYQKAIDAARAAGVTVVAAVGNEQQQFPGATEVPASCNGVIGVGAAGQSGAHSAYSNANDYVDLVAPGGDRTSNNGSILSSTRGGGTGAEEGTSFAAPYVAGTIALMKSVRRSLMPDEVERILEGTTKGTPPTHSASMGWGLVDVGAAVTAASSGAIPAAKPQPPAFPVGLVIRVSAQTQVTDPVRQAVAMSRFVFPAGQARHAVLARMDDFADALAGSALAFGNGPVLFTGRTGPIDPTTGSELTRVLPAGSRVYILGGTSALPGSLEGDLQSAGFQPVRLAGSNREATAAIVAAETLRREKELGFPAPRRVILATAMQWPDAVTAGSLGAWFGYPILLTDANTLSPETRDALATIKPDRVYVIGGTSAVSGPVAAAAQAAGASASLVRLAGKDRDETAVAVALQFTDEFKQAAGIDPALAIGVNLRRADGFTHVLSASAAVGAFSGVFVPVEGDQGDDVPAATVGLACRIAPLLGVVAGEPDIVTDVVKQRLNDLLEHIDTSCATK